MSRVLVTGAGGQLANAFARAAPPEYEVVALSRAELDIAEAAAVGSVLDDVRPRIILNAAAYTAVDRAETEAPAAWRANCDGPALLASGAARIGARMVHISTDFVFDGLSNRAYRPDDATHPLGVYGASKRAGEEAVAASGAPSLVVRTAWVYAAQGRNFLNTMLRLMGEGAGVRVVADQIGAPTSAASLARTLWDLIGAGAVGLMHFTDAGVASWYDFAVAIAEEGFAAGLLADAPTVEPIATSSFPTLAKRPAFSVLDCSATAVALGRPAPHWREALREVIGQKAAQVSGVKLTLSRQMRRKGA